MPPEQSNEQSNEQTNEHKSEPTRNGRASKRKATYSDDFLAWWEKYPRKLGKKAAAGAYALAARLAESDRGCSLGEARAFLLERAEAFAKSPAGQRGTYTPHPTTWLNRGSYDDDPSEWQKQEADNGRTKSADTGGGFLWKPGEKYGG